MHVVNFRVPKKNEIAELCEFTWYYLRSTDLIASQINVDLLFEENLVGDEGYHVYIKFIFNPWEMKIHGKFSKDAISYTYNSEYLQLQENILHEGKDYYYLESKITDSDLSLEILKLYFSPLHN